MHRSKYNSDVAAARDEAVYQVKAEFIQLESKLVTVWVKTSSKWSVFAASNKLTSRKVFLINKNKKNPQLQIKNWKNNHNAVNSFDKNDIIKVDFPKTQHVVSLYPPKYDVISLKLRSKSEWAKKYLTNQTDISKHASSENSRVVCRLKTWL